MDTKVITQWQKEVTNVQKYHDMGYTGKGIRVLCHENNAHGQSTMYVLKQIAPDAEIIYANVSQTVTSGKLTKYVWEIGGVKYSFDEMMKEIHPDIISCSLKNPRRCVDRENIVQPYLDNGDVIICTCSGNEGSEGAFSMYPNAITVGACLFDNNQKDKIRIAPYSGRDKDALSISYVGFTWNQSGTSYSTPFVAGQIALFMQRYGKISQSEFQKIIKPYCRDLGEEGIDNTFGEGLIVLPEELHIEEDREVQDMIAFKDVEKNRWSKEFIDWANEKGYVNGYPDGTFRPEKPLTREELCAVLYRIENNK